MNDMELRLECIRQAIGAKGYAPDQTIMEMAEKMYRFVRGEVALPASAALGCERQQAAANQYYNRGLGAPVVNSWKA